MAADLDRLSLSGAAALLERGELSPVEVTRAVVERIEAVEASVNAFTIVQGEEALEAAAAAEREMSAGRRRGPLHGLPLAVKDNIATTGAPTHAGGRFEPLQLDGDAHVVERLRNAGAVVVGKTNMHEFALGGTTDNPHHGPARNPWDRERVPGGSSGGSAVSVATREALGALGTDTAGSVRIPSGVTGLTGIRPTMGRVSNHGVVPLAWSMDTVGPLCVSARDCALMLDAIAGHDSRDPASARVVTPDFTAALTGDVKGLRIGIDRAAFHTRLDPGVERCVDDALAELRSLGAKIVELEIDHLDLAETAMWTVVLCEGASFHQQWLRDRPEDYGDDVRGSLELGEVQLATHYIQAQRYRALLCAEMERVLDRVDVLALPMTPCVPPPIGVMTIDDEPIYRVFFRFAFLAAHTGLPGASAPCGFADGLPVGLQLIGPAFGEDLVLRVADAYQRATDWHQRTPPRP